MPEIKQVNIIVYKHDDYQEKDTVVVKEINTLKLINGLIQDKKKEPLIFMITYQLELFYSDGSIKEYSGQGKNIRDKKGSYVLPSDGRLEKFLKLVE